MHYDKIYYNIFIWIEHNVMLHYREYSLTVYHKLNQTFITAFCTYKTCLDTQYFLRNEDKLIPF